MMRKFLPATLVVLSLAVLGGAAWVHRIHLQVAWYVHGLGNPGSQENARQKLADLMPSATPILYGYLGRGERGLRVAEVLWEGPDGRGIDSSGHTVEALRPLEDGWVACVKCEAGGFYDGPPVWYQLNHLSLNAEDIVNRCFYASDDGDPKPARQLFQCAGTVDHPIAPLWVDCLLSGLDSNADARWAAEQLARYRKPTRPLLYHRLKQSERGRRVGTTLVHLVFGVREDVQYEVEDIKPLGGDWLALVDRRHLREEGDEYAYLVLRLALRGGDVGIETVAEGQIEDCETLRALFRNTQR